MDMDPFDEFEMKPITEGLGFHKKAVKFNKKSEAPPKVDEPVVSARSIDLDLDAGREETPLDRSIDEKTDALDDLLKSLGNLETRGVSVSETLPRSGEVKTKAPVSTDLKTSVRDEAQIADPGPTIDRTPVPPPAGPIEDPVRQEKWDPITPRNKFDISDTGTRRGAADSPAAAIMPTPVSLSSLALDVIFVLALSMIFLVSLLMVTSVDLTSVLRNAQIDMATQLALGILYVSVYQMYVIISRSFFGRTLGEWTFDVQLGDDKQIASAMYPIRVMWRSFITLATGLITLPLFSFIVRRDLAKYLTGLQLYRKN